MIGGRRIGVKGSSCGKNVRLCARVCVEILREIQETSRVIVVATVIRKQRMFSDTSPKLCRLKRACSISRRRRVVRQNGFLRAMNLNVCCCIWVRKCLHLFVLFSLMISRNIYYWKLWMFRASYLACDALLSGRPIGVSDKPVASVLRNGTQPPLWQPSRFSTASKTYSLQNINLKSSINLYYI